MTLLQAKTNAIYQIKKIHTQDTKLLHRFLSFGIIEGAILTPLHHSSRGATLAIQIQNSQIALRESEAEKIEVELCQQ